jgi:pilus assembly protein CpaB
MRLLIFFIAIALAVGAFFFTLQITAKKEQETTSIVQQPTVEVRELPKVKVFTAREDIPIGVVVKRSMLDIVDYQQNLALPDMALVDNPGASPIDGMVARSPVVKGEVIMKSKFANPKDPSFLAAAMGEGMRLVTMGVDPISGGGGFIYPGDRVDVLITRDITMGRGARTPVSEVLIPNARVLAVNLRSATQAGEGPATPTNVSLEVTQLDAERIRLSEASGGKLSLVLRSLKDKNNVAMARPAGLGDLSRTTTAAYFPVLYDNLNSYTPEVVTDAPAETAKKAETAAASVAGAAGAKEAPDLDTIDLIRGVKRESVQIQPSF